MNKVLLGINCAHNYGINHYNIRPGKNLLVDTDEVTKIANLGLSKTIEQGIIKGKKGIHQGMERYMAPDSILNVKYGIPVDIWAFGYII